MDFKELKFYLIQEVDKSTSSIYYKSAALNVLNNAELRLSEYEKNNMSAYACCIGHEISISEHKDMLVELSNLIRPFLVTNTG